MMDRQNFIDSLQRQAQPDSVIPSSSATGYTDSVQQYSGVQQGMSLQGQVSSAASMNSGQNVITSMYQAQVSQPMNVPSSSGYNSMMMAPSSSLASTSSFQTSSSFTTSNSVNPSFVPSSMGQQALSMQQQQQPLPNNSYQVNNKILDERLMQAGQSPIRKSMIQHQQSWSEGAFESVLPSVDMSVYNQSSRRKSLEGMSALAEMGMNRVIEPFEFKLPKTMTMIVSPEESESSSQVSGSEGGKMAELMATEQSGSTVTVPGSSSQSAAVAAAMNITITSAAEVIQSPPREYKSVSMLNANVSSCPVTSSTINSCCVNEPVLNVVIPKPQPQPLPTLPIPEPKLKPSIPETAPIAPQPQPLLSSNIGMMIPVTSLIPETKDIPVSQYSVRTRLTPVSVLSSFEEPLIQTESPKPIPPAVAYEFKAVQSSQSELSSLGKQFAERGQILDPTLRKTYYTSEQISPPKSAISSRKSSGLDFSTASVTSPDTEALLQSLSTYDPTNVQPMMITLPDLAFESLLKKSPNVSLPKSSPPKVMTMNPFSVILKSFDQDSPPGEENPSPQSSQKTPSCDFVKSEAESSRKQHVTTQTTKSIIPPKLPPSSLPKTTHSPSGSRNLNDRKLIKSNAIMTATTATSPLTDVQREETTRTDSNRTGVGGGFDFMSVRKLAETERRASFGGSTGAQSIPGLQPGAMVSGITGRSGAQLPALPSSASGEGGASNKGVMNEKGFVWNRSGSLSEQAFIEQINEMRGLSPTSGPSSGNQGTGLRSDQSKFPDEQLNFEIDDEYEREGEDYFEDDEDDIDVRRQQISEVSGEVYTIPEESEEESPKVEKKDEEFEQQSKLQQPRGVLSLFFSKMSIILAPRASRSLPSVFSKSCTLVQLFSLVALRAMSDHC